MIRGLSTIEDLFPFLRQQPKRLVFLVGNVSSINMPSPDGISTGLQCACGAIPPPRDDVDFNPVFIPSSFNAPRKVS